MPSQALGTEDFSNDGQVGKRTCDYLDAVSVLFGGKARGSGTRSESLSHKPGDRPWAKTPSPPTHIEVGMWGTQVKPAEWPQLAPSPSSSGRGPPELQTPGEASPGILPRGASLDPLLGQS